MEAEPCFRRLNSNELPILLDLYTHLHATDDPLPDVEILEQLWETTTSSPWFHYFVIEFDGQVVSSCCLAIIPNFTRGARPYGLIENVVTHSEYRKRGFGTMLLRETMNYAWQQNCYKVMLLTSHKDVETLHFYEQVGLQAGIKTGFVASPPS